MFCLPLPRPLIPAHWRKFFATWAVPQASFFIDLTRKSKFLSFHFIILRLAKEHFKGFEEYFQECYAQINVDLNSLQEENCRYINLSRVFDGIGDQEEIFVDSYHFGDKGNEIIAQSLFTHIKELVLH